MGSTVGKVAIILLAGTQGHEGLGRMLAGLQAAKEFIEAGDDVKVVFEGAAVAWLPKLTQPEHQMADLLEAVGPHVEGACAFCSQAFGVGEEVEGTDVSLLEANEGHPSVRSFMQDGYQVLTF
ncbi:MAG: DsrE family protein [Candidatus Thermoplasmatota archaeon]|nr:DsrE family protein [Candidatus Thermoplasmatota archaeon]